jgi:hypothetical protein
MTVLSLSRRDGFLSRLDLLRWHYQVAIWRADSGSQDKLLERMDAVHSIYPGGKVRRSHHP